MGIAAPRVGMVTPTRFHNGVFTPCGIESRDFRQAARTESRNLATSSLRRLLSLDSDCAAE